jgi:hypothetical protein
MFDTDEHPRMRRTEQGYELDTDLDSLAKLRPAFRQGGTVTAGNASGLNDGAAALVLMSAEKAAALGLQPLARWVASAAAGVDPRVMGLGPVSATRKALQRAGVALADVDLIELNEAFAVQSLAVMRELGLDPAITNVNGGAIALGHPLGCSGARILTTLLHEMLVKRHNKTTFIGAHVGCYAENLGWVSKMLADCPNYYVDISARISELGRQPYTARRFFMQNQDRILFGTDHGPELKAYQLYYRFLETDDEYFNYSLGEIPRQGRWHIYGIYLPDAVLKKVYGGNAARILNLG